MIVNVKCITSKVNVGINLKKPYHNYPSCHLVSRQSTFPVTTTRNIPWVEFLFPTLRSSRLHNFFRELNKITVIEVINMWHENFVQRKIRLHGVFSEPESDIQRISS